MRASECPAEKMPSARYPCENQACVRQGTWRAEELRWSPGGDDGHGTAWPLGFYCGACHDEATHSGAENLPTLAEEMARRTGVAGERVGTDNLVKMQLVGTLICTLYDIAELALLRVSLVDEDGEREEWPWRLSVDHDWPGSGCLPGDLVSVEGYLTAMGEGDPILIGSRVHLLRPDITGEQREQLLECEDPLERWDRAYRIAS